LIAKLKSLLILLMRMMMTFRRFSLRSLPKRKRRRMLKRPSLAVPAATRRKVKRAKERAIRRVARARKTSRVTSSDDVRNLV